jgi:ammonium transporter, Amt family
MGLEMQLAFNAPIDIGFVLGCSALVFFMQAGFCLLEAGLVRTKNSINVAVKNVMDCLIAFVLFLFFGFGLMFGVSQSGLFGNIGSVDFLTDPKLLTYFLFQAVFCSTAATIVSGAVAERTRLSTYIVTTIVVSGLVYPVIGHWIWGGAISGTGDGWLKALGFIDWSGCVAVHVVGGFCAIAAAHAIGPRRRVPSQ